MRSPVWIRPRCIFSKIFNVLLFDGSFMEPVNVPAKFEFVALPVPDNGQSLDTPTLPFLPNFSWTYIRMDPVNASAKFAVRTLPLLGYSDCSFGLGLRTRNPN